MPFAAQHLRQSTVPGMDGAAKTPFDFPADLPTGSRAYYERVQAYADRIRGTRKLDEIVAILDEALGDTRSLHGNDALRMAEEKVQHAQDEIEGLRDALKRAVAMSATDSLTETVNRRGLAAAFEREGARSDRYGHALCAAMIDLDNFKAINDARGHAAGDAALLHLAAVMRSTLRPSDVIARVGGEEFLVLFPDTNEQAAFQAMTRLQGVLAARPVEHAGFRFTITFTASVALRAFGEPQSGLSERLDRALYLAKHSGKNRVLFATP
jgi:diguanylate cyclase